MRTKRVVVTNGAGRVAEVAAVPVEDLREFRLAGRARDLVFGRVRQKRAGLVVELRVEPQADVRLAAQRRARDGGADEREVDARLAELLADDAVLDVVVVDQAKADLPAGAVLHPEDLDLESDEVATLGLVQPG